MGVGKEAELGGKPHADAGSAPDQLCDLCMPLGPHLLSENISVVRSLPLGLEGGAWHRARHTAGPVGVCYCYCH